MKDGNATEVDPISYLDFRVGCIIKSWKHENSTKLYCELIDIGREKPIQVASGLAEHIPKYRLNGAMVVVLVNLKPRKIAGFLSEGMVMVGYNKTKMGFVVPPPGTNEGDPIRFRSFDYTPLPELPPKKKYLEHCLEHFTVGRTGKAMYKGKEWYVSRRGELYVEDVTKGVIS
jgi:methionine--tRNA ligase beta chain